MVVNRTSPGLFTITQSGSGQGAVLNQDGTVNSTANPARAGSTVVLYSDGITEAENEAQDEFGNERLEQLVRTACGPAEMRDRIAAGVDAFVGAAPQYDDQTLVIARVSRKKH